MSTLSHSLMHATEASKAAGLHGRGQQDAGLGWRGYARSLEP
jgi:hypothetical protein